MSFTIKQKKFARKERLAREQGNFNFTFEPREDDFSRYTARISHKNLKRITANF
jgi:hypothetical protein